MSKSLVKISDYLETLLLEHGEQLLLYTTPEKKISRLFYVYLICSRYYIKYQLAKLYSKDQLYFLNKKKLLDFRFSFSQKCHKTHSELLQFSTKNKNTPEIVKAGQTLEKIWTSFVSKRDIVPSFYLVDSLKILRQNLKTLIFEFQDFRTFSKIELFEAQEHLFFRINENLNNLIEFFFIRQLFVMFFRETLVNDLMQYGIFDIISSLDGFLINCLHYLFAVIYLYENICNEITQIEN